jgi:cell division protein FtsB
VAITIQTHLMALFVFLLNKKLMTTIVTQSVHEAKGCFYDTIGYLTMLFDFHQKRKLRAVINSPVTQGFILFLVFWIGWSAYVRFDIAMEMRDRRILVEQQTAVLEARKEALEMQVEYLSSERGIEAEMRRQFDVALPGEQVVVIVEEDNTEPVVQPLGTNAEPPAEHPWYFFWR